MAKLNDFRVRSSSGMAKGGSIPETPPLESKIDENPYS